MKKLIRIFVCLLLYSFIALNGFSEINTLQVVLGNGSTSKISQYGITWYFSNEVQFGRFLNGDYWVVGPVEVVEITPHSTDYNGRIINGSMINPAGGVSKSGFDSFNETYYDNKLNVSLGISEINPLILKAGNSLVSSKSKIQDARSDWFITDIAILTVLAEAPEDKSFRPPYSGNNKDYIFYWNDVDLYALSEKVFINDLNGMPAWEEAERNLERPFMDFAGAWSRRLVHGDGHSQTYGRETSQHVGVLSLMLLSNESIAVKRNTIIGFIQRGLDLWGIYNDSTKSGFGNPWGPDGGHHSGRKWFILFSGFLLQDSDMLSVGYDSHVKNMPFQEDGQTEYIDLERISNTQSGFTEDMYNNVYNNNNAAWLKFESAYPDIATKAGTGTWATDSRDSEFHPYDTSMLGMPEWHARGELRREGNALFYSRYYRNVAAMTWHAEALAVLSTNLDDEWYHDSFFDYVHRHVTIARTGIDPFQVQLGYNPVADLRTFSTSWSRGWPNQQEDGSDIGNWVDTIWDEYWALFY